MAAKTLTEKVDELNRAVAHSTARLDYHDRAAEKLRNELDQLAASLQEVKTKQALVDEKVAQFQKTKDETSHWQRTLLQQLFVAFFGGVLGAGLTLIVQLLVKRIP